ncbi:MAG TPA: secondary thiamine-phosphate synthase enzyme YjbQ [Candidatus Deferrimicrobium sp.]|nr:secondary thiamine-phosphate synthase enzyme YjbQ [Candidatus Deferrimicrobium sp.]
MKIYQLDIKTTKREEIIRITPEINAKIKQLEIQNGICYVFVPHTTAGITINENADENVKKDFLFILKKIVPQAKEYLHSEGNSDSHVKAILTGFSQNIIIQDGKLRLGTWQELWFCEYDGPRTRKVVLALDD